MTFVKRQRKRKTAQSIAGEARMASMTPRQREDFASKGGRVGGKARAKALSAERRAEIARKAAEARWGART
jgi:general stress protein YciG